MARLNNQRVYDMTIRVYLKTAKCCEVNDFFFTSGFAAVRAEVQAQYRRLVSGKTCNARVDKNVRNISGTIQKPYVRAM